MTMKHSFTLHSIIPASQESTFNDKSATLHTFKECSQPRNSPSDSNIGWHMAERATNKNRNAGGRVFVQWKPGFTQPWQMNPINKLANVFSGTWYHRKKAYFAAGKVALLFVVLLSSIMLSIYAHQRRHNTLDQDYNGHIIQDCGSSGLWASAHKLHAGTADQSEANLNIHWKCGRPTLPKQYMRSECVMLHRERNDDFAKHGATSAGTKSPRVHQCHATSNYLMYFGQANSIEHQGKMPGEYAFRPISTAISGEICLLTSYTSSVISIITLEVAIAWVVAFTIAAVLLARTSRAVMNHNIVLSALFTGMGIWLSSLAFVDNNRYFDLEFALLAIFPWCIGAPICIQAFVQDGSYMNQRTEDEVESRARKC
ncbi:hypothetical protein FB567DRAFT_521099 [Paraphoma chrysanthemicola]|uniref:Uncharacterized protein n=1 Tax=Paraphoma chrysanthemicola TaxID=798071 RepID=A0A8K0W0H0_9PLEO|nr:hypothetical protein FB567DRAFT_521099 [Paraphoma chrysanthemicola]